MSKSSITIDGIGDRVTTSPGEMLREEFLLPLGLSANALALALRVPANRITAILKDQRAVTADTAMRLGRYFGTSARFWLNLQQAYDLSLARRESAARIEREVAPREVAA
jgi:addiction module HigA family antidote